VRSDEVLPFQQPGRGRWGRRAPPPGRGAGSGRVDLASKCVTPCRRLRWLDKAVLRGDTQLELLLGIPIRLSVAAVAAGGLLLAA